MLFLISTPIGNLKDFSFRAIATIEQCDYLLCEDTRRSGILLKHYELKKPLKSFHAHNEKARIQRVIDDLQSGYKIGLLSDAGTPTISDPGGRLVEACCKEEIEVIAIPGACAAIVALAASGLDATRFQFCGFLARKKGKLTRQLKEILAYEGTSICYESPYRIAKVLAVVAELEPTRYCVVARELTKKFETFTRGSAADLCAHFSKKSPPKGEIVLLFSSKADILAP